jgi:hypothetical protein
MPQKSSSPTYFRVGAVREMVAHSAVWSVTEGTLLAAVDGWECYLVTASGTSHAILVL